MQRRHSRVAGGFGIGHRRQRFERHPDRGQGSRRLVRGVSGNGGDGVADIAQAIIAEYRLVGAAAAKPVASRHIGSRHHRSHARHRRGKPCVDTEQRTTRPGT